MPTADLTLSNPLILRFLEGDDSYVPTGELIYVHTRLIQNNFLSDLERMVGVADQILAAFPKEAKLARRLVNATTELGSILPVINEETAPRIMHLLRDVYKTTKKILALTEPKP